MYDDILYIVPRMKALQFFDDTVIHLSHKQSVVLQIAILQCIFSNYTAFGNFAGWSVHWQDM